MRQRRVHRSGSQENRPDRKCSICGTRYMGIMAGIGTVLADDPMLNVRVEGWKSPVRIVCDSSLRIPFDSQIVRSAKEYRTIVAYAGREENEEITEKIERLHAKGVDTVCCPDEKGQIDLKKLMTYLGNEGIDSILLERRGHAERQCTAGRNCKRGTLFYRTKIIWRKEQ